MLRSVVCSLGVKTSIKSITLQILCMINYFRITCNVPKLGEGLHHYIDYTNNLTSFLFENILFIFLHENFCPIYTILSHILEC